jgi:hypothetical protein
VDWQEEFESELANATAARSRGNEGRARVCARRAAGIAVRAYLAQRNAPAVAASTLDLLEQLRGDPRLAPDLASVINHLTLRVDEDFGLPAGVDLVAEARQLRDGLFPS